jgi:hypothetical protein
MLSVGQAKPSVSRRSRSRIEEEERVVLPTGRSYHSSDFGPSFSGKSYSFSVHASLTGSLTFLLWELIIQTSLGLTVERPLIEGRQKRGASKNRGGYMIRLRHHWRCSVQTKLGQDEAWSEQGNKAPLDSTSNR